MPAYCGLSKLLLTIIQLYYTTQAVENLVERRVDMQGATSRVQAGFAGTRRTPDLSSPPWPASLKPFPILRALAVQRAISKRISL